MAFVAAATIVAGTGAAIGLGSALYGGYKAGKARDAMSKSLDKQNADNESWYNNQANTDYMQRADTLAVMKNTRDQLKEGNKRAANMAVVTGATPEAQAVAKEQSNKVITDTNSRIAATGQAWKDNIQNQYLARKAQIGGQQYGAMEGSAQSYEALMGNGIKQMGSSVNSLASAQLTPKAAVQTSTAPPTQADQDVALSISKSTEVPQRID